MAAEETLTWDIAAADGGAQRCSIAAVGDAELEDEPGYEPPMDGSELYANMINQALMQIVALNRTCDSVRFTIDFSAGAPFVDRVQAAGTLISASTFTLTDNGAGDTTIAWDAGDFPALDVDPRAWMSGSGSWLHPVVEVVSPTSIRVRTRNNSNVLTDGRVNVAF